MSSSPDQTSLASASSSQSITEWMRRHALLSFFIMAYSFSWITAIPCILAEWGFLPNAVFVIFFTLKPFTGPFLAAFLMTGLLEGKDGVRRLRKGLFQFRAGWPWYAFILLGIPALFLVGIAAQPGALTSFTGLPRGYLVFYLINFILIFFGGGPLGEEPGWRGFALPRMQARFGGWKGALFLGLVWTFWHLPDFLTSAQGGGPGSGWATFFTNLPIFTVMVVAISIVMTWVYNRTDGNLFIAILLHAAINTGGLLPALFPAPGIPAMTLANLALLIGISIPAVLALVLTRGRLGYQAE